MKLVSPSLCLFLSCVKIFCHDDDQYILHTSLSYFLVLFWFMNDLLFLKGFNIMNGILVVRKMVVVDCLPISLLI